MTTAIPVLVGLMAAVAAWLLAAADSAPALRRLRAAPHREPLRRGVIGPLLVAAIVTVSLSGEAPRWLLVLGIGTVTLGWLARRHRQHRRTGARTAEVAAAVNAVSLLLAAGRLPEQAILEASDDFECLRSAAAAARLGSDIPEALTESGGHPGSAGLIALGAAWRVSTRIGAPIADVMSEVVSALGAEREVDQTVEAELAAVRAGGQILGVLPIAGIALGALVGAEPIAFLVADGVGSWLLLAAASLTALGLVWMEHIASGRPGPAGRRG